MLEQTKEVYWGFTTSVRSGKGNLRNFDAVHIDFSLILFRQYLLSLIMVGKFPLIK